MNGWFESADEIFLTMDYFPLGDLGRLIYSEYEPPFPERTASQIIRQVTEGIRFMHESGFVHCDLKPNNILIATREPRWNVKITDFGISKRAAEENANLHPQSIIGTEGYVAPEVLRVFSKNLPDRQYSFAVDIWAIGVICIELLLKRRLFPTFDNLRLYLSGKKQLEFDIVRGIKPSEHARDFIRQLLVLDPTNRPTANLVLYHEWLAGQVPPAGLGSLTPVPDRSSQVHAMPPATLATASTGSIIMSNMQPMVAPPTPQDTGSVLTTYNGTEFHSSFLLPCFRKLDLQKTRYFVMRSNDPIDIETSAALSIWVAAPNVNKILDNAYRSNGGKIVLIFSVTKSQKFCGVARMASVVDWKHTDPHWQEDKWQGRFRVRWICFTELPFVGVKTVPIAPKTPGYRAISCFDGTEIVPGSAFELLKAFSVEEREQRMRALFGEAISGLSQ
ncbi:hypothetical protein ABW19_dt0207196 [Dactylella cylindrospora]|nr:hypothetical protein ABW19_dt0207196 [Dactylella cylindrospora]